MSECTEQTSGNPNPALRITFNRDGMPVNDRGFPHGYAEIYRLHQQLGVYLNANSRTQHAIKSGELLKQLRPGLHDQARRAQP